MITYSYAFGDHILFLRKDVWSYPNLYRACAFNLGKPLLHIYVDAQFHCNMDAMRGGTLVSVIEYQLLLKRVLEKGWRPGQVVRWDDVISIIERYVMRLVRCQLKEQV